MPFSSEFDPCLTLSPKEEVLSNEDTQPSNSEPSSGSVKSLFFLPSDVAVHNILSELEQYQTFT
jgi:hypothetical protein